MPQYDERGYEKKVVEFIDSQVGPAMDARDWLGVETHVRRILKSLSENQDKLHPDLTRNLIYRLYLKAGARQIQAYQTAYALLNKLLDLEEYAPIRRFKQRRMITGNDLIRQPEIDNHDLRRLWALRMDTEGRHFGLRDPEPNDDDEEKD